MEVWKTGCASSFCSLREALLTDALERLRKLHERSAARNQDLSEEAAIEIAERVSHELIDDAAARGDITFERDGR